MSAAGRGVVKRSDRGVAVEGNNLEIPRRCGSAESD